MTVYVDNVRHRYRRMIMCHMWADTLDELLSMADHIGVQRKWLQSPPAASWTHFDISLSAKEKAITYGAILTDKYGPVEHCAKLDISSGIPSGVSRGQLKLQQIRKLRTKE